VIALTAAFLAELYYLRKSGHEAFD
jgi:hypothetical protein